MQVSCPSCKKAFALEDSKVPSKPVTMKCPACGGGIKIAPPAGAPPPPAPPEPPPQPQPAAPPAPEAAAQAEEKPWIPGSAEWERMKHEVTRDVLKHLGVEVSETGEGLEDEEGEGRRRALVCEDEELFQGAVGSALAKLGYRVEVAPSAAAALELVRKHGYDIVTVDNRFPDDEEGGYQILQALNGLPPDARRKMFVAFISADLATLDLNSAFALGANLTVAKKDVRRLDRILGEGMKEHERFYRVFYKVQEELQKEEA